MTDRRHSPPIRPDLPPELIDDIIEKALTILDGRSLSSMALVSHHFRVQVNQKRFSTIILDSIFCHDCIHLSNRLNLFAILVDDERRLTPGMVNVASFITSFEFSMVPREGENRPFIDAAMTVLCTNLFRPTQSYQPRTEEFLFKFELWNQPFSDEHYHWDSLRLILRQAFVDLCRNSKLTKLQISTICAMPMGVLQGSRIKHLHLREVSIDPSLDLSSEIYRPVILQSLVLDESISFATVSGLLCGRYTSASNLFSGLTDLKITLRGVDDVDTANQILTNATSLETLMFSLPEFLTARTIEEAQEGRIVHYGHLPRLKRLCLFPNSRNGFPMDKILGAVVPQSLQEIQVLFSYYLTSGTVHGNIFPLIDLAYVDSHLSHRRYSIVKRIVISLHTILAFDYTGLNLTTFREICRDSVKKSLPRLSQSFSESLDIRIDLIPSSPLS